MVLIVAQGANITSVLFGNLASRLLIKEWQTAGASLTPFQCRQYLPHPTAGPLLREALRWNHLNGRALLGIGRVIWLSGDCAAAQVTWEKALSLAPHDAIAALLIADAQFTRGEVDPALTFFRDMKYSGLFYGLGQQAETTRHRQEAVRWYEIGFSIAPTRKYAQPLSAIYLNVTNEPEKATALWAELQRATALSDPDHWFAAGQAAEIQHDFSTALHAYENGLQLARDPCETFVFSSQAALNADHLGDLGEARSLYEKALEAQPRLISSYLALSQLELSQEQSETALAWLERAREIDPESELPDYYEGVIHWQRGAKEQALSAFQRAYSRNPKNPLPSYYLALYAYDQHNLQQAIAHLQDALSNYGGMMIGWLNLLTDWYMEAGKCQEALATYMRVLEWEPENHLIQEKLAGLTKACP